MDILLFEFTHWQQEMSRVSEKVGNGKVPGCNNSRRDDVRVKRVLWGDLSVFHLASPVYLRV